MLFAGNAGRIELKGSTHFLGGNGRTALANEREARQEVGSRLLRVNGQRLSVFIQSRTPLGFVGKSLAQQSVNISGIGIRLLQRLETINALRVIAGLHQ